MTPRTLAALAAAAVLLGACAPSGQPARPAAASPRPTSAPPPVYAAVGASETAGIGAMDPGRQAWPTVLYLTALPAATVYYNLGIPGETVHAALTGELPQALEVHPTVATVWLNVNDIAAGVSAADYETELGQLVHALRRGGLTRVLVANTPVLDRLPAYLQCLAGTGPPCPFAGQVPEPPVLDAEVDAYNAAIARVTAREGATLIDLHAGGEVPDVHPDWVGLDGFHPSAAGYAAIAARFASAL
jgi:lysophospholipase L1-like esterase